MIKCITSAQNPWLKQVMALQEKAKNRRSLQLFTVEGLNEIRLALGAGYKLKQLIIQPKKITWEMVLDALQLSEPPQEVELIELNDITWGKVVVRESGQNALGIFAMSINENKWDPIDGKFYLVVESVEKPGNLGALLRSADAAGAAGVILCDEHVDGFHPQVIRNSVGTVFTVPLFVMNAQSAWEIIHKKNVTLFTTFMENSVSVWEENLQGTVALLVGAEHQGVSEFWRNKGNNINIPMFGSVDSLNVSVAASILMYEAKRQRTSNQN